MKVKSLAVAAGVGAPLILGASASGGFVGVECSEKRNEFGLLTVNVYAVFDRPGEDEMDRVRGTNLNPLTIEVVGGTFYQHPFGTDRPPQPALFEVAPSLRYDTFVTIGVKSFNPNDPGNPEGQPEDDMVLGSSWPGFGPGTLELTQSGWLVGGSPDQGDPFDPDFVAGDGRVLIGQFSTADGSAIQGTMLLDYVSNGVDTQSVESFFCGFCQMNEECSDGDPCNGEELCVDGDCLPSLPEMDCNGNGIRDSCDIADGTSTDANANGVPDDCDVLCQSDLDNDGMVGILDFLELLANWGPCP